MHYNKNTTCQTMCDTPKIVLRGQEMEKFKNKQAKHIQFLKNKHNETRRKEIMKSRTNEIGIYNFEKIEKIHKTER